MAIKKKIKLLRGERQEDSVRKVAGALSTTKEGDLKLLEDYEVYICSGPPKLRSVNYNAYYWGVVLKTISEYTGTDPQTLHLWYKTKFAVTFAEAFGEIVETVKETSGMKMKEFDEYVMLIREHSINIGCGYIPLPNEVSDEVLIGMVNRGEV